MLVIEKDEVVKRSGGKSISDPDYVSNLSKGFSEALITGKFCDVKIICQDSNLWAHRLVLSTVSPFLTNLLVEMEKRGDDVITIFLPRIKGYHMKLVLDYIYSGTMYLCGAHMQYVIQVMEVLNLNCGVSVNKMVQSAAADQKWIEVEHSTMKIKSNFPPSLPEYGEPSGTSRPPASTATIPAGTSCTPATEPAGSLKTSSKGSLEVFKCPDKSKDKDKEDSPINKKSDAKESTNKDLEPELDVEKEKSSVDDTEEDKDEEEQTELPASDVSSENITDIVDVPASTDDEDFEKATEENTHDLDEPIVQDCDELKADEDDGDAMAEDITDGDVFAGSDDDDEPVMVEIDEDFAVDSLSNSQAEQNEGKKHKCALCGRMFRFYENLRVHLTGHLGVKVTLSRCRACKRNFKNQTELDLHMKAHSYARHLGKYRLAKSAAEAERATRAASEAKIITTVGTRDKKILRKYTKNRSAAVNVLTRKRETSAAKEELAAASSTRKGKSSSPPTAAAGPGTPDPRASPAADTGPTSGQQFSCKSCDKSFIVKSLYLRHMKQKHDKKESQVQEVPRSPAPASVQTSSRSSSKRHSISSFPAASSPGPSTSTRKENPYSRQYSTPSRKRDASESSDFSPPTAKKRRTADTPRSGAGSRSSGDNNLKCPDCDKIFVAKTILERHQYTAKHGVYGTYSSDSGPGSPSVQHVTERQVDCHLCGQVFLRVKDLVKHREKVCTAWLNPGT